MATLDFLVKFAPVLQKLIPLDCMIGIDDTEKFLSNVPGEKIKLPANALGTKISPEVPTAKAIKS